MVAVQGSRAFPASSSFLETKLLTTRDGTRYVYDYVPAKQGKSTVLLLHGFPATRHEWHFQVDRLSAEGYGIIAPDLLGFGDTDRSTDLGAFRLKSMSVHLMEILDSHKLKTVVGVAHDWGTVVLSRSCYWHSERYEKVAFVSSGYSPVGEFFNIDAINAASMANWGYAQYGYWYFFNSYDATDLLEDRVESAHSLFFPRDPSSWAANFAHIGAARIWLEDNTIEERADYVSKQDKESWLRAFGHRNAFASSLLCYQSLLRGTQVQDEADLSDERKKLRVPVLSIGGKKDLVARSEQAHASFGRWAMAGHTVCDLDTGHWVMYEDPDGFSSILIEFLES